MRNFKVFLWIFIIFLIQTVVLSRIHVFFAVPSAVMVYMVSVMMLENEFRRAAVIGIVCAVAMGALCGRDFVIVTLFYTYAALVVFALRKKPAYVGFYPKTVMWSVLLSSVLEVIFILLETKTLNIQMLLMSVLPTAIFNAVLALIIYPILKKTMYKEKKKKLLIV